MMSIFTAALIVFCIVSKNEFLGYASLVLFGIIGTSYILDILIWNKERKRK